MSTLIIKELTGFRELVDKNIIIDGRYRPVPLSDKELTLNLINLGNTFLEEHRDIPANADVVIWFDIHFSNPEGKDTLGMTWANNPKAPDDPLTGMDFFWRIWSEVGPTDDKYIFSLETVQKQMADYMMKESNS